MRAYVLGIPDRYRGGPLEDDLARLGIAYEVVAAQDGSQWSAEQLESVYSRRAARIVSHRQLTPGEVACALGHRAMMARFAEQGDPWAVFLEDDARLPRPLQPVFDVLGELPDDPAVIQIEQRGEPRTRAHDVVRFEGGALWRQDAPAYGTAAYLMNRPAALLALRADRDRRVDSTADWPFRWADRVRFWGAEPGLAHHDVNPDESLILAGRTDSLLASRSRGSAERASVAALRITGALALYGRANGVPFWRLYRRDLAEARSRGLHASGGSRGTPLR